MRDFNTSQNSLRNIKNRREKPANFCEMIEAKNPIYSMYVCVMDFAVLEYAKQW